MKGGQLSLKGWDGGTQVKKKCEDNRFHDSFE